MYCIKSRNDAGEFVYMSYRLMTWDAATEEVARLRRRFPREYFRVAFDA
jgi:hypothetical protein